MQMDKLKFSRLWCYFAVRTSSPDMTVFFLPPFFFTMAASTTDPKLSILDDEGRLLPGGPLKCVKVYVGSSLAMLYYALTHL